MPGQAGRQAGKQASKQTFFLLQKIHKDRKVWPGEGKVPPGRPIIADCGSESYASAIYIDHFLAPLA